MVCSDLAQFRGEAAAFGRLICRYREDIVTMLSRQVDHRYEVDDVFQDVVIRAFYSLQSIKKPERFRSWLMRIAFHTSVDWIRRKIVQKRMDSLSEEPRDASAPIPGEPEEESRERCLPFLVDEIDRLKPVYAAALLLRGLEGMGYKDISHHLGLSVPCVKMYLHRARLCLRNQMAAAPVENAKSDLRGSASHS